jgi:hypothetical protein
LLLASLGCLLLGIVTSSLGFYYMNRWVRVPRADQVLEQGLKGFDDRYQLYNYVLPAPHVLLSPSGLFVLTTMGQDGVIRYEGGKFHRAWSAGRILRFLADGDAQVLALQHYLDRNGAAEGVQIQNVIVFFHPRADIVATDPPRPVVVPKGLKRAIRKGPEGALSSAQCRNLEELFDAASRHPAR